MDWFTRLSRPRKALIGASAMAVIALVGILAWIWLGPQPAAAPTGSPSGLPPLTAQQATEMSEDIASGDIQRVREALALPAGRSLDESVLTELATLRLHIDVATLVVADGGAATARGEVTDRTGVSRRAVFHLIVVNGRWMLVDVVPEG